MIENKIYSEIEIGQTARLIRTLTQQDIKVFAAVSGDTNPMHLDSEYANASLFHAVIGHGMWSGSLISAILGTQFPGPGTIYLNQTLKFKRPVKVGDTLTAVVTVLSKNDDKKNVTFNCEVVNQKFETVVTGEAIVLAPTEKIRIELPQAPEVHVFDPEQNMKNLLGLGSMLSAVPCGVVHPCDEDSLRGAIDAANQDLIVPILIGPEKRIREIADQAELDISNFELISTEHSHHSSEIAAELAAQGKIESLMKGSLHTDELMRAVLCNRALKTKRRLSHIFRFDVPTYHKPLLITDAAINLRPSLDEKRDIVQNSIDLAHILGLDVPKVAILSAVEMVNSDIPSTIEAAALCKMAQRGQIIGGVLDGPLAFDNAISMSSVRIKHIESEVAGDADILVVPDLESGNMLAKQLEYMVGATGCGIVMGSKVPIALTSRADGPSARMASALLAKLVAHHNRRCKP